MKINWNDIKKGRGAADGVSLYEEGKLTNLWKEYKANDSKLTQKMGAIDCLKLLNIIASVDPVLVNGKVSASGIADKLRTLPDYVGIRNTPYKLKKTDLISAVKFTVQPRSYWLKGRQLDEDNRRWGSLTPLGMYAYKEHFKINYEDWDLEDPSLELFAGGLISLEQEHFDIVDFALGKAEIPEFDEETIKNMYTMKGRGFNKNYYPKAFGHPYLEKIIKPVLCMFTRGHLAQDQYRMPGVHILDPVKWDNVPELEGTVTEKVVEDIFEL